MRLAAIVCAVLIATLAAPAVQAADVAKIGVVDFQKILENSSAGKAAQAEINRQGKQMEADLKKRGDEIDGLRKKLEREALVMSKEMRDQKEREVRIKINDIKSLQKKYMSDFKGQEARLLKHMQKDVSGIITDIGKKGGYLLILERREAGIFYHPATIDITDEVIKRYNARAAARAGGDASGKDKKD